MAEAINHFIQRGEMDPDLPATDIADKILNLAENILVERASRTGSSGGDAGLGTGAAAAGGGGGVVPGEMRYQGPG